MGGAGEGGILMITVDNDYYARSPRETGISDRRLRGTNGRNFPLYFSLSLFFLCLIYITFFEVFWSLRRSWFWVGPVLSDLFATHWRFTELTDRRWIFTFTRLFVCLFVCLFRLCLSVRSFACLCVLPSKQVQGTHSRTKNYVTDSNSVIGFILGSPWAHLHVVGILRSMSLT